jgi:signal transduction histidine kinase
VNTLLLISSERLAEALADLQSIEGLRVVRRARVGDASSAVAAGVFDVAVLVVEAWTDATAQELQLLRRNAPRLPVLVAADIASLTQVYAAGADAAMAWPESAQSIRQVVARWVGRRAKADRAGAALPPVALSPWSPPAAQSPSALEVLRDFAKILSHSLDERSFAQRLVEQLAEILGVVRIALFLEQDAQIQPVSVADADPRLVCAASVGIPSDISSCVELSRESGVGRLIVARPGVISKHSPHLQPEFQQEPRIGQEFELLGCEMALPIRDRDKVIGVALLGGRITGAAFTTEELNLAYFLMGELGMAIRNSRLHRGLSIHHELLSRILETITSGSLVIGSELRVMHANRAAAALLGLEEGRTPSVGDLPSSVRQLLEAGAPGGSAGEPIFHEQHTPSPRFLRFSVIPLYGGESGALPPPVIVLIDDWTQIQASKQAEIASANSQLVTTIAARFAHEIRNSLVPLSTHAQLFQAQSHDPQFLASLHTALQRETLRIRRLSDQMLFLAGPSSTADEVVAVSRLVNDAFVRAQEIVSKTGELTCTGNGDLRVRCTRESLTYALQEILANALQSVLGVSKIRVKLMSTTLGGRTAVAIEVSDSGNGFTPETAARATEPFYTTRTTGVGLGLAVARKIVDQHGGELSIHHRGERGQPDVQIKLPAA